MLIRNKKFILGKISNDVFHIKYYKYEVYLNMGNNQFMELLEVIKCRSLSSVSSSFQYFTEILVIQ